MPALDLTFDEQRELLAILERYYPDLRIERANTDDRDYRKYLGRREECMRHLIERLRKLTAP